MSTAAGFQLCLQRDIDWADWLSTPWHGAHIGNAYCMLLADCLMSGDRRYVSRKSSGSVACRQPMDRQQSWAAKRT